MSLRQAICSHDSAASLQTPTGARTHPPPTRGSRASSRARSDERPAATRPSVFATTFEVLFSSEARCWGRLSFSDWQGPWRAPAPGSAVRPRCPPPRTGPGGPGPQAPPGEPAPPRPPHWVTVTESAEPWKFLSTSCHRNQRGFAGCGVTAPGWCNVVGAATRGPRNFSEDGPFGAGGGGGRKPRCSFSV